jgi:nitrate reductase NapE component
VNLWIAAYFVCGACFGLATFSNKHLFSEGPDRRVDPARRESIDGRLTWVLVCSCLWPIMALTGVYSFLRLRKAKVPVSRDGGR